MTTEKIRLRLTELHSRENELNAAMGQIDKEIKLLTATKAKIAKRISNNMKHRNKLIEQL